MCLVLLDAQERVFGGIGRVGEVEVWSDIRVCLWV